MFKSCHDVIFKCDGYLASMTEMYFDFLCIKIDIAYTTVFVLLYLQFNFNKIKSA